MNRKLLRVLEQIEAGDAGSLVCELPRYLLKDIAVDEQGQVDLASLLVICKELSEENFAPECDPLEEQAFEQSRFWFRMIYDESLAVDPVRVKSF